MLAPECDINPYMGKERVSYEHYLEASEDVEKTLEEMAGFTGITGKHWFRQIVTDALRTYEWVLVNQSQNKAIVVINEEKVPRFEQEAGEEVVRLTNYICPNKLAEARKYFSFRS